MQNYEIDENNLKDTIKEYMIQLGHMGGKEKELIDLKMKMKNLEIQIKNFLKLKSDQFDEENTNSNNAKIKCLMDVPKNEDNICDKNLNKNNNGKIELSSVSIIIYI
jgi:hypothetical protein